MVVRILLIRCVFVDKWWRETQVGSCLPFPTIMQQKESGIFDWASSVMQPSVILAGTAHDTRATHARNLRLCWKICRAQRVNSTFILCHTEWKKKNLVTLISSYKLPCSQSNNAMKRGWLCEKRKWKDFFPNKKKNNKKQQDVLKLKE